MEVRDQSSQPLLCDMINQIASKEDKIHQMEGNKD